MNDREPEWPAEPVHGFSDTTNLRAKTQTEGGIFKGYAEMTPDQQAAWRLGYAMMEKRHHAFLRHLVDAEGFDEKFGLTLPGDSALAALINSAIETLARA